MRIPDYEKNGKKQENNFETPNLGPSINKAVIAKARAKPILYLLREYNKPTIAKNKGIKPIYRNASEARIDLKWILSK